MGLLETIFPKNSNKKAMNQAFFKLLNGYTPAFSSFNGSLYEMDTIRAAIHSKAKLISKLKPEIRGSSYKNLEKILQFKPNPYMNTYQYLYRLCTYLEVNTYAFIIPLYSIDANGKEVISGFYPLSPKNVEIVGNNELYLKYNFSNGQTAAIEYDRVGVMTKFSYKSDLLGDGNEVLNPIMSVLDMQKQGMQEAIKRSALIQFIATATGTIRDEDLITMRKNFSDMNLSQENDTGIMILDSRIGDVKQVEHKNYVIDEKQMNLINENIFSYFGTNKKIIQSNFTEEEFNAFYESEIESFALQCSLAHTNMLFNSRELAFGNVVMFTANRLQYASNKTKLEIINSGLDRGWLNINESREIMNMTDIGDEGNIYRIRLDFVEQSKLNKVQDVEDKNDVNNQGVNDGTPS